MKGTCTVKIDRIDDIKLARAFETNMRVSRSNYETRVYDRTSRMDRSLRMNCGEHALMFVNRLSSEVIGLEDVIVFAQYGFILAAQPGLWVVIEKFVIECFRTAYEYKHIIVSPRSKTQDLFKIGKQKEFI